jgi:glycosyltransferase involved in cell wall biosynthesis
MLPGVGYVNHISLRRIRHNRSVARSFIAATQSIAPDSGPDVVMVSLHALELAEAVAAYTASRAIPLVVDVLDLWPEVYLRAFPPALKGVARRCLHTEYMRAKRILRSAKTLTAASRTYLDWALSMCPEARSTPRAVFPLGYDDDAVDSSAVNAEQERLTGTYGIDPAGVNIAFVGQLSHSYDLHTVIEAARLLYPSFGQSVRFFIAGDGVDGQSLRRDACGIPTIAWLGWLSHPAVAGLLRSCSAGLVSYAHGATQSMPNKPFEYLAAGVALLSCLPGELAELIDREGIGVQYTAGSPKSLAECVRYLANNPEQCASMRRRARDLFEADYRADDIYGRLATYLETISSPISPITSRGSCLSLA